MKIKYVTTEVGNELIVGFTNEQLLYMINSLGDDDVGHVLKQLFEHLEQILIAEAK